MPIAVAIVFKEEQYHAHDMLYAMCSMTFKTLESSSTYTTTESSPTSRFSECDSAGSEGKIVESGSRTLPYDPTMIWE